MKNLFKNLIPFITLIEREIGRTRRVIGQAIVAPLITASLYIFTFGFVLGPSIKTISGIPYISFVFPGVFAINLMLAVFGSTSFMIFMMKFQKTLEDFLTLPISYTELVLSIVSAGIFRGLAIMLSLSLVGFMFGVTSVVHPFYLLAYVFLISFVFGIMGIVIGIWADNSFEKIQGATNFILTPLTFLGGAFYSVHMLPANLQFIAYFNPIFYAVDGIRFCLTGYHDASLVLGLGILTSLSLIFLACTVYIFKTGWKLRS
jgi:ABC-2 type transport system permease protein